MKLKLQILKLLKENRTFLIELKDTLLILFTLIDFLFIFIITFFNVTVHDLIFMSDFDLLVCILLFINLIQTYYESKEPFWSFIKSHVIDILSIIPFNFIFLRYLAVFRIIKLFKVLQLFQIFKVYNVKNYDLGALKYFIQNRLLKTLVIIVIFYIIISSIILNQLDPAFNSLFNSFWYNIVTLTSVGYGDITPVTYPGKIIGMLSIIFGVLFVSIFTAAMSSLYMEKPEEETRKAVKVYIKQLKGRNSILQHQVNKLDKDIEELNVKLDVITKLLEEEMEKDKLESNQKEKDIDET